MGHGPIVDDKPRVKKAYLDNKWKVDKYPYLYEDMDDIGDFRVKFCPSELLRRGRFLECNNVPSIDDGDLAGRFERFVRDYSGLDPFDIQYVKHPLSPVLRMRAAHGESSFPAFFFFFVVSFPQPESPGVQPRLHDRRTIPVHGPVQFHGGG